MTHGLIPPPLSRIMWGTNAPQNLDPRKCFCGLQHNAISHETTISMDRTQGICKFKGQFKSTHNLMSQIESWRWAKGVKVISSVFLTTCSLNSCFPFGPFSQTVVPVLSHSYGASAKKALFGQRCNIKGNHFPKKDGTDGDLVFICSHFAFYSTHSS